MRRAWLSRVPHIKVACFPYQCLGNARLSLGAYVVTNAIRSLEPLEILNNVELLRCLITQFVELENDGQTVREFLAVVCFVFPWIPFLLLLQNISPLHLWAIGECYNERFVWR